MKLSKVQIRALHYLYRFPPNEWASNTPVTQKCLNVLSEKKLVKVCFDSQKMKFLEMITDEGREAVEHSLHPTRAGAALPSNYLGFAPCR